MAWARDLPLGRRPHFFKIFFPCNGSKHLGIPRGFWRHIEPQTSGYVGLTGPSGNVWNVKLVRAADGGMSFQNGWEEFVADHALGIGDFLVFRYDGDMNFRVLVFDPTSCEKEDTFHVLPCHEVKIRVEGRGQRSARQGSLDELIATDTETFMAFAPENMRGRENNLAVACQAFTRKQNCSVESQLEEGYQIVDGSLIANEVSLDRRISELGILEPQVGPTPLLRNMEPEIVQIPASLNKSSKDNWMDNNGVASGILEPQVGPTPLLRNMEPEIAQIPASLNKSTKDNWMDNSGVASGEIPQKFSHENPPSSSNRALCKQCFFGHSDYVTCEVREEPQSEQAKCRPESGASLLKQNVKNQMKVAGAPLSCKSHNSFVNRKRWAVKRCIQRKPTISCSSGAAEQHCHEHPRCLASSSNDNVKIKVDRRIQSCRRPVTEDEKAKALEAALLFQSEHPFCLCVMRDSYVYRGFFMYLPNSFTQHLPKYATEMKLWGPDNKVWRVMYKFYDRGGALSGGWGEFSRANNLEMDDVCIFELIKLDEIQVHVFRVVEEITPLVWNPRRRRRRKV